MKFHEAYKIMREDPEARFTWSDQECSTYSVVDDKLMHRGARGIEVNSINRIDVLTAKDWIRVHTPKVYWRRSVKFISGRITATDWYPTKEQWKKFWGAYRSDIDCFGEWQSITEEELMGIKK